MYKIKSYYFIDNKQPATILYLHGWGCNYKYLLPFDKCTSITNHLFIDLPAFGKNEPIKTPLTLTDFANITISFIELKKLNIKAILGHSFGGKIAVLIAQKLDIKLLFLIAPSIYNKKRSLFFHIKIIIYKLFKSLNFNKRILSKFGSKTYRTLSAPMKKTMINVINEDITEQLESTKSSFIMFFSNKDKIIPYYLSKKIKKHTEDCIVYKIKGDHFAYFYNIAFISNIIEKVVEYKL